MGFYGSGWSNHRGGESPLHRPHQLRIFPASSSPRWITGYLIVLDVTRTDDPDLSGLTRDAVAALRLLELEGAGRERPLLSVEPAIDGSVYLQAPADTPLALELIDDKGRVLARTHTPIWIRPNERRACLGCHVSPAYAPPNVRPQASRSRAHSSAAKWGGFAVKKRHLSYATRLLVAVVALAALGPAAPIGAAAAPEDQFIDVQTGSGVDFVHSFGDAEMSNLVESSGFGVCVFDFDGDELLDIYLVNGATVAGVSDPAAVQEGPTLTNHLYKNLGSWQFEDATDSAGVGDTGFGMGCVAGDLDNDGDKDLIVTNYGPDRWYRNDGPNSSGTATFSDQTPPMVRSDASWSLGATLADFDRDGLLDVYTGKYVQFDPEYRAFYVANRFPGPLAYRGEQDRLYRNQGEWQFEDLTQSAGIANPEGRAMGVGAFDYDADGWIDIFVANDAMANCLYRNLGDGRFEESALITGLAFGENGDATAAMGIDFADFNRDGLLDLVVPDMTFFALYEGQTEGLFRDVSPEWLGWRRLPPNTWVGVVTSWTTTTTGWSICLLRPAISMTGNPWGT